MSMSTHVVGIRPANERWQQMKAAYDACVTAGVTVPSPVVQFFDGRDPDPAGVVVELPAAAVKDWTGRSAQGIEVSLAHLPEDVSVVRFYNSW